MLSEGFDTEQRALFLSAVKHLAQELNTQKRYKREFYGEFRLVIKVSGWEIERHIVESSQSHRE